MHLPYIYIRWQDVADIIIMSFLVYQLYSWFKNTKAFQVLIGLGSLGVLYLITRRFGFFMTSWIFQELGTALFVLIIVIFQSEIRQALYRFSPLRNFLSRDESGNMLNFADLCKSIFSMAASRTGALIVFQRKEPITEYLHDGVIVDSVAGGQLICSIFNEESPLHDGAVIIRKGRLALASVYLPLSLNSEIPLYYGTRHRAAIGLSERSDAAVVVVSEERGDVSVALAGKIQKIITPEQLASLLIDLIYTPERETLKPFLWKRLHKNFWQKLITVLLVCVAWLIISTRKGEITNILVPVTYRNLPANFLLMRSYPDDLEVQVETLSSLIPAPKEGQITANIDLSNVKEGYNFIHVDKKNFDLPSGVAIYRIRPTVLNVVVEKMKQRKPVAPPSG